MGCISFFLSQASKLGDQVAELHLYNQKLRDKLREEESTVGACRSLSCSLGPGAHPRVGTQGDVWLIVELQTSPSAVQSAA